VPTIRGLPTRYAFPTGEVVDLSACPDAPTSRDDPRRDALTREFTVWRERMKYLRLDRWTACAHDPEQQEHERERCRRFGAAYFLAVWGWMDDPRISPTTERPIGPTPFIPYPFQVAMLAWFDQRLTERGMTADGVVSKSRDMGATWNACGWALHGWLFRPSWQVRLVSRKEELVDRKNDMDSMFGKIDFMLDRLPAWMLPRNFDREIHRLSLRLHNPENGNGITGESTTSKTLRGGRTTVAIYDEAAFIPGFLNVWATGANAASVRLAISSESLEEGDDFVKLRTGDGQQTKPALLELNYWLHPDHDDRTWLPAMRARFGPDEEAFEREIMRNPHAGFGAFVFSEMQHVSVGHFPYEYGMHVYIGIDPGLQDLTGLVALVKNPVTGRFRAVEAYAARGHPPEYYASLLLGMPDSEFSYVGTSVYDPHDFMAFMRGVDSFTVMGDPAGYNRTLNPGETWYSKMGDYYSAHHPFTRGLPVIANWRSKVGGDGRGGRDHQFRRIALMRLLPDIDFHDTPGVRALLESLKRYKFERQTAARLTEPAKPAHTDDSHIINALAYVAVNLDEMRGAAMPLPEVMNAA